MFDFSWSEIMVIGLVALIAIGPKDMPVAIRAITRVLKKMRKMAAEFQGHVDEMMREADLGDVQETFRDLRGMNMKSALGKFVDADGSINKALSDPFSEHPVPPVTPGAVPSQPYTAAAAGPVTGPAAGGPAPAFIPPNAAPPAPIQPEPPPWVPPHEAAHSSPDTPQ